MHDRLVRVPLIRGQRREDLLGQNLLQLIDSLGLDPKVTADQRGHGVGVAIAEYTKTSLKDRAVAAKKLEESVLGKKKVVRMPQPKAS